MKIAISLIVTLLVLEVAFANDVQYHKKQARRGNVGVPAPTAYPTIPSSINKLTSMLFSPNKTSGETPIYGLLKTLTSDIYPHIANATYAILKPLNHILNGISSNLYNGLCAPPIANYTAALLGGHTGSSTGADSTTNSLGDILNILGLGSLVPLFGGGNSTGGNGGTGTLTGGTGTGTGAGGTQNNTPFLQGVPLAGSVNATLNLDPASFNAILSQLGQTQQSLFAAIKTLGWTSQKYVDGFTSSGKTPLLYLQQIFWQAGTGASGTTSWQTK